ncbi:Oberon, PHD finger domain [Dillenia turbinata]|uniref:Oberon, PHD finger domain n=1 Tax=Dillenia turbinata TaxID=194707 RepID=A0AAN8ZLL6_9MAGN
MDRVEGPIKAQAEDPVSSLIPLLWLKRLFCGGTFDPSKCSSMEAKREFVHEISNWSHGAPEMLQSWSRQEILQILCAEMGKERKYTGLTKLKIIENLLKIVAEKKSAAQVAVKELEGPSSPTVGNRASKRQRKLDNPSRLPVAVNNVQTNNADTDSGNTTVCKNSACKATLRVEDTFCKRCTCCICLQYDDNKDPSLWLVCSSEPPFQGDSCGMSCHLECALKHERSGIARDKQTEQLDGSFACVTCGKENDLLGCWRKQLMVAKETRRVDILCYRVSLSHKLLSGTAKYQELHEIVDKAVKKLEAEIGLLTGLPVKRARGIVNRLSSGPEVQRLCAFAMESLDSLLSKSSLSPDSTTGDSHCILPRSIKVENVCPTSLTVTLDYDDQSLINVVGCNIWHRKFDAADYAEKPTGTLFAPKSTFLISNLSPATEYIFKLIPYNKSGEMGMCEVRVRTSRSDDASKNLVVGRCQSPMTNYSGLSNPSSEEDETCNGNPCGDHNEGQAINYLSYCKKAGGSVSAKSPCVTEGIQQGSPGNSVSTVDDEHALEKVGSLPDSDVLKHHKKSIVDGQNSEDMITDNRLDAPPGNSLECVPFGGTSEASLPITPCKSEIFKENQGRGGRPNPRNEESDDTSGKGLDPQVGSSSKKRTGERPDEGCAGNGPSDKDFEYYVKVIRWLECQGHIEKNFRQKFLTWYSLRATPQEVRIVKVFVDTLIEDPACLAGQLVDTFSNSISSNRSSVVPAGFCMKLWH